MLTELSLTDFLPNQANVNSKGNLVLIEKLLIDYLLNEVELDL